jgi:hypothetical protein
VPDDALTHSQALPSGLRQRDPLLGARLRRTDYALFIIRTKKVVMDAATISVINNARGLLPLQELGRQAGLSPAGTVDVARKLLEAGYLTRVESAAPVASKDPLTPEVRALVRKLRPILVRYAGEEAAFALEVDAPQCNDLPGLVIAMRRRFNDATAREEFTAAATRELGNGGASS